MEIHRNVLRRFYEDCHNRYEILRYDKARMKNDAMKHLRIKNIVRCPLCGASKRRSFEYGMSSPEEPNRAVECTVCGLIYVNVAVEDEDIARLYEGYLEQRITEDTAFLEKRMQMYALDYAFVERFLPASCREVLDVGCGEGDFLSYFGSSVHKHGIEVDSHARTTDALAHHGIHFYDSFSNISPEQLFDVIVFRGTLQYMPDLAATRDFCFKHLKSGGALYILALPNADSLLARVQREHWALFNRAEHRYHFGFAQLERLFGPDLSMTAYDLPYLGTPYENYREDYRQVVRMFTEPEARKNKVPFFGSMLNAVFKKNTL